MKSKISKISFVKPWSGERGTVYFHDIEFENGDKGQAGLNKEEPTEYGVGTEHEYALIANGNYAAKIKFLKQGGSGGGVKKQTGGNASFALSYSKDILVASWENEAAPMRLTTKEMFSLADKMYEWMEGKK